MGKRLQIGDQIPEFYYDTPYEPQKSFYELTNQDRLVMMIFLRNFGHPITRHYIMQYIETIHELHSARLVCVVRTVPQKISHAIPKGSFPFELICDAEGVLYDYFAIPECASKMKSYSLEALKIIKKAQKEGYVPSKNEPHQLPLTLMVGKQGKVEFAHYGRSVTDLPMDCAAIQKVAEQVQLHMPKEEQNDWLENTGKQDSNQMLESQSADESEEISEAELLKTLLCNEQHEHFEQEAEPQSGWNKSAESAVFAVRQNEPIVQEERFFDSQQLAGKFIGDKNRTPKKVDLSALGFFEQQES